MGPRSDNRGLFKRFWHIWTQSPCFNGGSLQWVHGRITVVYVDTRYETHMGLLPSMGPRSDNRGYESLPAATTSYFALLQWVHGRITVVMNSPLCRASNPSAAPMGARWDTSGYVSS